MARDKFIQNQLKKGLCTKCAQPRAENSKWFCEKHLRKHREYDTQRRAQKKGKKSFLEKIFGLK